MAQAIKRGHTHRWNLPVHWLIKKRAEFSRAKVTFHYSKRIV